MNKIFVLVINGKECVKDCDSDYLHMQNDAIVAASTDREVIEKEQKNWSDAYDRMCEAAEGLTVGDPDLKIASEAYDAAMGDKKFSWLPDLFWNSWADEFYRFGSTIKELDNLGTA